MKLLNHTLLYLSASLIFILSIWAVVFYLSMMEEVYDSIDDGLENYKILIIQKADSDTSILKRNYFDESNYAIRRVSRETAINAPEVFQDTAMYMKYEDSFEIVRMLTTYFSAADGNYYQLKIIASMVEEDDLVADLLHSLLWLYVAVITSAFIINNWVLRKIWRPFYQLQHKLRHFKLGEHQSFEPPKTKIREFRDMNQTVAELLRANIAIFQQQKQFIENASHELQTPLAISMNKLELLLEQYHGTEEQTRLLANAIQHLERLTRLNRSLLLLSKIENRQFSKEAPVGFNALWKQQAADFEELLDYRKIQLDIHEHGALVWTFNPDLANILITNLLKNAIVHNHEGGQIHVAINDDRFEIANTGSNQPLDTVNMFSRFYRTPDNPSSTGLGLAIVKSILQFHHLQVVYGYEHGMHRFTVRK